MPSWNIGGQWVDSRSCASSGFGGLRKHDRNKLDRRLAPIKLTGNLVERIAVRFRAVDFFLEESPKIGFAVNDLNDFLQFGENEYFLCQSCFGVFDSGRRERILSVPILFWRL